MATANERRGYRIDFRKLIDTLQFRYAVLRGKWFAARIAKSRAWILLYGITMCAGETHAQIGPARRTVSRAGARGCAAGAATTGQRRHVAAGFARNVIFDYLPCVFGEFVLPVSAQRRQRDQQASRQDERNGSDRGLIEPLLHADLDARAPGFGSHFDRQRGGQSRQLA